MNPFPKTVGKNGISFSIEAKGLDEDGYLFIDRALVIKAVSHIVQNSIQAILETSRADKKRSVKVSLLDDGETVRVSVSDKGPGISKRNLQYVFEPFFSTRPDHVGLGLTLVRRIMWEHGGKTRVESHLGKGTTVTLYFPKDRRRKVRRELISPEADRTRRLIRAALFFFSFEQGSCPGFASSVAILVFGITPFTPPHLPSGRVFSL